MSMEYCVKHDAYFDSKDDKWLEGSCGDKTCDYCKDRPDKPSEARK